MRLRRVRERRVRGEKRVDIVYYQEGAVSVCARMWDIQKVSPRYQHVEYRYNTEA
jgi:hypothetical protein